MYRYKNNISVFTIYYTSGIYKSIYIYTVYRRTISRLWSCCFGGFGADHRVIWNRPQPDWTPSSFMFVILGPAPLDLDLDGGTETDVSLWAVAGRPSSSLTVVHTTSSWFPFTFRTLCHRTAVGKKRNNVRNPLLKDVITWNLKLMLLMGTLNQKLTSSSDRSTSSISLSSDSLSGSSLSSCAVFSYSWQRISSFWRP